MGFQKQSNQLCHALGVNEHAQRSRSRTTLFVLMFNWSAAARCSMLLLLLTRLGREKDSGNLLAVASGSDKTK